MVQKNMSNVFTKSPIILEPKFLPDNKVPNLNGIIDWKTLFVAMATGLVNWASALRQGHLNSGLSIYSSVSIRTHFSWNLFINSPKYAWSEKHRLIFSITLLIRYPNLIL